MLVKYISDVVHAGTLAVSLQLYSAGKASECSSGGASPITVTQLASWKILTPSFPSAGKSFDHTLHLYLFICLTVAYGWVALVLLRKKGSRFNCLYAPS